MPPDDASPPHPVRGGVGLVLPLFGVDATPSWAGVEHAAVAAEELGATAVWATDHVLWHLPLIDCLTAVTLAARVTKRVAVGTAVLQVPLRTTATVARAVQSLQDGSGGRFVLGVGTGHHRREFQAAGVPDHQRGVRTDDALRSLRDLLTTGGPHRRYQLLPTPAPVPLWVGGNGPAARRRAATLGDAWFPLAVTPEELASGLAQVAESAARAGRPHGAVTGASTVLVAVARPGESDDDARARGTVWLGELFRIPSGRAGAMVVAGSPSACADAVARQKAAGADHVAVLCTDSHPVESFSRLMDAR